LAIRRGRVADRQARREREREVDVVGDRPLDEGAELGELVGWVRLAPQLAVVRVVLRRVLERVHPVRAEVVEETESLGLGPRRSVEALDEPAIPHPRRLAQRGGPDDRPAVARLDQLAQLVRGVERPVRVDAVHHDVLAGGGEHEPLRPEPVGVLDAELVQHRVAVAQPHGHVRRRPSAVGQHDPPHAGLGQRRTDDLLGSGIGVGPAHEPHDRREPHVVRRGLGGGHGSEDETTDNESCGETRHGTPWSVRPSYPTDHGQRQGRDR
jgi:hypothetical protein